MDSDPEMQALRKQAEDYTPVRKPIWFQILLGVAMVGGGGIMALIPIVIWNVFDFRIIAFGLLAGGLFMEAVLGWMPGRYRIIETDEKCTLWKPIKLPLRAALGAGSVAVLGVGVLIAWHDYTEWAEKQAAASKNAPAQQQPAGKPAAAAAAKKKLRAGTTKAGAASGGSRRKANGPSSLAGGRAVFVSSQASWPASLTSC